MEIDEIPNAEFRMTNSEQLRTVLTPHPALRRGRNARRLEVELNERFGSSSRRHEGSRKVRTTTESPNAADEVGDLRTFKQATDGFPLLGGSGQGEGSTQVRNLDSHPQLTNLNQDLIAWSARTKSFGWVARKSQIANRKSA